MNNPNDVLNITPADEAPEHFTPRDFCGEWSCDAPRKPPTKQEEYNQESVALQIKEAEAKMPNDVRWASMQFISQDGQLTNAQAIGKNGEHYDSWSKEDHARNRAEVQAKMDAWRSGREYVFTRSSKKRGPVGLFFKHIKALFIPA